MFGKKPVENLVVDAGALIKGVRLEQLADALYTTPQVMAEIRDRQAREMLAAFPFELRVQAPSVDAVKAVTEFAKKTGDIAVLSAPDIGILALTFDLERKIHHGSIEHLRTEPVKAITQVGKSQRQPQPKQQDELVKETEPEGKQEDEKWVEVKEEAEQCLEALHLDEKEPVASLLEDVQVEQRVELQSSIEQPTEIPADVSEHDSESSDEGGWITPANVQRIKRNHYSGNPGNMSTDDEEKSTPVACITTDFAMQNVLLQMNMALHSLDGIRIRHLKNWVLRCHACYTVTKEMSKKFCPKCGNATLIRTSCSVDPVTGQTTYYLKRNFQYNNRGTCYAIPAPKGGRKNQDLVLREDQKEYQAFLRKQKRQQSKAQHQDLFDLDYVPLTGDRKMDPLRSAGVIGHGRRNPNEARRKKK